MSKISKNTREKTYKSIGDHQKYISRITKTLYYTKLPKTDTLSLPVTELAAELFSEAQRGRSLDRLHCDEAAKISRNACVSPCSLVLALLYLEKLKTSDPEYLERSAPSDLFLVSLMVSCKFLYDDGETDEVFMDEWAASGGISVKQLIHLEREFLKAINWEVYVNELTFWKKLGELEMAVAKRQGETRGFFTYTELEKLLNIIELHNLIHCIVTVSVILAASYTAGLLTMMGSIFIVSHMPGTCIQPKDNQLTPVLPLLNNVQSRIKTDCAQISTNKTEISKTNTLNIWNTGLLLASVINFCNNTNTTEIDNVQEVPWDWWTIPVMNWLVHTSQIIENLKVPIIDYFGHFLETSNSNLKHLDLEDQIHKATKTRIQDQMENSWHKEWTDTIRKGLIHDPQFYYYLQNMKS